MFSIYAASSIEAVLLTGTHEWFLEAKQTKTISVARSLGIVHTDHR